MKRYINFTIYNVHNYLGSYIFTDTFWFPLLHNCLYFYLFIFFKIIYFIVIWCYPGMCVSMVVLLTIVCCVCLCKCFWGPASSDVSITSATRDSHIVYSAIIWLQRESVDHQTRCYIIVALHTCQRLIKRFWACQRLTNRFGVSFTTWKSILAILAIFIICSMLLANSIIVHFVRFFTSSEYLLLLCNYL